MVLGASLVFLGQSLRPDTWQKTAQPSTEIKEPPSKTSTSAAIGVETIADLAQVAGKSTVNIDTSATISRPADSLIDFLVGTEPIQTKGLGSGFIIRNDGYILTNNHVVDAADEIRVTLQSEPKPIRAKLVGRDPATDLAVLKIEKGGLEAAGLGESKKLRPGDWVIAIGSPLGLQQSVTLGIVSALNRSFADFGPTHLIQTDAAINPGNSGGPLLNIRGEVIGVNVMVRKDAQNIGFAIPIDKAREVAAQLIATGKVSHPHRLGISFADLVVETGREDGIAVVVLEVEQNGPAHLAGIRRGDVILAVNGEQISSSADLKSRIHNISSAQEITIAIFRDGRILATRVAIH